MYESLQACSELLTQYGGHTMAAGLSLPAENYELFRQKFNDVIQEQAKGELFERVQNFDEVIQLTEINMDLYNKIQLLSPFGPEMEEPIFQTKNLVDTGYTRTVGSDQSHLSLSLQEANTGKIMKGIFFKGAESLALVQSKQPIDILFKLTLNNWNNEENIELEIKDLRLSGC
jgi:single-stranded-DNA-specific exonuclease